MSHDHQIQSLRPADHVWWWSCGAAVVIGSLTLALYSGQLAPEVPPAQRPLQVAMACHGLMWLGFAVALWRAVSTSRILPASCVVVVAVAARAALLPSALIQSDDVYRYVLDGHMTLAGMNPFSQTPSAIAADPPPKLLGDRPDQARLVIDRVNNPDVPTIYPPLAQTAFALGALLCPWSIFGPRLVFTLFDVATIGLLWILLRRAHGPPYLLVLYAWNPVVIKEISNSAHLDSLAALTIVGFCMVLTAPNVTSTAARSRLSTGLIAGLLLGAAILTKLYPMLLIPPALVWAQRRAGGVKTVCALLTTTVAIVLLGYAPFASVGIEQLTEGLRTYGQHWINNPGMYQVIDAITSWPRSTYGAVVAAASIAAAIRLGFRADRPEALVEACSTILLAWLLLAPACFPWYAVSLCALAVLHPRPWAAGLSAAFGLYYLLRYAEYHHWTPNAINTILWLEHGTIWLSIVIPLLYAGLRKRTSLASRSI